MLCNTPSQPASGEAAPFRILKKFAYLLSARWVREALQAAFLIYLARISATTYGEFMLAIGLGSILLLVAEFGLNLPLVSLLSQKDGDRNAALSQVVFLKAGLLVLALGGVLGFMAWQDYALPLKQVMFMLCAGVGLEALSNTFFVTLQVQGRQDLQGKIAALAAGLGFGYGLIALALGAPPLLVAAFKLIESLVNLGGSFMLVRSQGGLRLKLPSWVRLGSTLRLGLIFALIEVSAILYNKANLFFLQKYAGAHGVAQYSVTWQTVDGISGLVSNLLLQSILFPLFVQLWESDRARVSQLAQNTARWLMVAAVTVMFVLFIESDRIITLVYGPKYAEAIWLQKILVVTVAFAFFHNLAAFVMISMRLQRLLLIFYLGGPGVQPALVLPGHSPGAFAGGGPGHGPHQRRGGRTHRIFLPAPPGAHSPASGAAVGPRRSGGGAVLPPGTWPPAPGSHRSPGPGPGPRPGGQVVAEKSGWSRGELGGLGAGT